MANKKTAVTFNLSRPPEQNFIVCSGCGRRFETLQGLEHVRNIGLALAGVCPDCGAIVWCTELWRKRAEEVR